MMPSYPVGPGRENPRSCGAVIDAYVDTSAIDFECPHCHAKPNQFCHHDSGRERRMPCPLRIAAAAKGQS